MKIYGVQYVSTSRSRTINLAQEAEYSRRRLMNQSTRTIKLKQA